MFGEGDRQQFHPRSPVQPGSRPAPLLLFAAAVAVAFGIWTFQQERIQDSGPVPPGKSEAQPTSRSETADRPSGDLRGLFSADDYPAEALDNNEQGLVVVRLDIDKRGRVKRCVVTESSGYQSLDRATCRILQRRARLTPARDVNGDAVESSTSTRIRWQIGE